VPDDDDILQAYEYEFDEGVNPEGPVARSNRGFWLVTGSLLLACVLLLLEIFANRSIGDDIGTAQHDLRVAQAGAERVFTETGSYEGADANGLTQGRYDGGELIYVEGDKAASRVRSVSVTASASVWAAAVEVRPGTCFYLRLNAGATDPLYGVGTECTGTQALSSKDGQW
jgi:hypothetical protein